MVSKRQLIADLEDANEETKRYQTLYFENRDSKNRYETTLEEALEEHDWALERLAIRAGISEAYTITEEGWDGTPHKEFQANRLVEDLKAEETAINEKIAENQRKLRLTKR